VCPHVGQLSWCSEARPWFVC